MMKHQEEQKKLTGKKLKSRGNIYMEINEFIGGATIGFIFMVVAGILLYLIINIIEFLGRWINV